MRKMMIGLIVVTIAAAQWASAFDHGQGCSEGDRGPGMGMHKGGMGGGMGGGCPVERLLKNPEMAAAIGLSNEQKTKLENIRKAFDRNSVQLKADLELARMDLMEAMQADKTDREAIFKAMEAVNNAEFKLKKAGMNSMLDAKGVLTDDQLKKIQDFRKEHGKKEGRNDRGWGKDGGKECDGKKMAECDSKKMAECDGKNKSAKDCPKQNQKD